ncbi:hypothetical protein Bbelb_066090 [Branchiostoma belcheri]|nr:hypothetical protein Bbelb_066090 [Branchiostoma belcheri]
MRVGYYRYPPWHVVEEWELDGTRAVFKKHTGDRLHKFTEALKGLVQSYPKVTVWDHRRLWRRNPNYFAPHARSLMLPPDPPRNLEVHSSSGNNPPFKILATGMRLTAYTCPIWETSSITRVILAPTSDTPTRTVNVGSGHRVVTGIAVSVPVSSDDTY